MSNIHEHKLANIQRNVIQEVGNYLRIHSWDICMIGEGGDSTANNGQLDPRFSYEVTHQYPSFSGGPWDLPLQG